MKTMYQPPPHVGLINGLRPLMNLCRGSATTSNTTPLPASPERGGGTAPEVFSDGEDYAATCRGFWNHVGVFLM